MITKVILLLTSLLTSTHRSAVSGKDVVINDINNPYTQQQILEITNLKAHIDELGDVTDYIVLIEDNYKNNINKEGIYEQKYIVNLEGFEDYYYILLINNINFNESDKFETIQISLSNKDNLNENKIISEIINQLNIKIYNYQLIDSNYDDNDINLGSYYQSYLITTTSREKLNVLVEINVIENKNYQTPILIVTLLVSGVTAGIIIIKKWRINKND